MNPLLLGPRLVLRALDDLHGLTTTARDAVELLRALEQRAAEVQDQIDRAVLVAEAIESRGEEAVGRIDLMLALGERIDARGEAVLALGEAILQLGDHFDVVARELLEEGKVIQATAREVADRGAEVATALPLLQRAVDLADPLEGAVERLGRIVDRLPGGRAAAPRGRPWRSAPDPS